MKRLATDWVVGFVDGEGSFQIDLNISDEASWGIQIQFEFNVSQHKDDIALLNAIGTAVAKKPENYKVNADEDKTVAYLKIKNKPVIWNYVLPYFQKHQLRSRKHLDFEQWRKAFCTYWKVTEVAPKSKLANLKMKKVLLKRALERNRRKKSEEAGSKYSKRLAAVTDTLENVKTFSDNSTNRLIAEVELKLTLLNTKIPPAKPDALEKLEKKLKILKKRLEEESN